MAYKLDSEKKYWYTTGVNNVQWRYPTVSDGIWNPIPSGGWGYPLVDPKWEEWASPNEIPIQDILKKPETLIDVEGIKRRLREEIFLEVREYIDRIVPAIISMLADRWISILGEEKKYSEGLFCFNCGAPIPRGKEKEICSYCGN